MSIFSRLKSKPFDRSGFLAILDADQENSRRADAMEAPHEETMKRLRHWATRENIQHRAERVELSASDSEAVRAFATAAKVRFGKLPPMNWDDLLFFRVPCKLDCAETRYIPKDPAREQLQVLSATCFTPEPKP